MWWKCFWTTGEFFLSQSLRYLFKVWEFFSGLGVLYSPVHICASWSPDLRISHGSSTLVIPSKFHQFLPGFFKASWVSVLCWHSALLKCIWWRWKCRSSSRNLHFLVAFGEWKRKGPLLWVVILSWKGTGNETDTGEMPIKDNNWNQQNVQHNWGLNINGSKKCYIII